jgi:hypothetical protein
MFNECDPPFMSPLVKHLCKIRNNNTRHHGQADNVALQEWMNNLVRENQIQAVNNDNNKRDLVSGGIRLIELLGEKIKVFQ